MSVTINGKTYPVGRDSTNPNDIPVAGTDYAMGYVNGRFSQWPGNGWDRFSSARHFTIDVLGNRADAHALDVEPGDVGDTSPTLTRWVSDGLALYQAKRKPCLPILYLNRSELTPAFNTLQAAGFHPGKHFLTWIATLDGTESVADMTGVFAVQYKGEPQTGGHYDESIVYLDVLAPAPAPVPPPVPAPTTETGLLVVGNVPPYTTRLVTSHDGGKSWV